MAPVLVEEEDEDDESESDVAVAVDADVDEIVALVLAEPRIRLEHTDKKERICT